MNRYTVARGLAIILLASVAFIVIYKAVNLPLTYDEVTTYYTSHESVWDILTDQRDHSTNNHILHTLFAKGTATIFGYHPWSFRLPNLLTFCLFAGGIWILARRFFAEPWWLFIIPFLLLPGSPHLLDFFSLARGYGMGNSLMTCSILSLLLYISSFRIRWFYATVIFAALAAYAQFSFLIYWAGIHLPLMAIVLVRTDLLRTRAGRIHLGAVAGIDVSLIAVSAYPLMGMHESIWDMHSLGGFFRATLVDTADRFCYGSPPAFASTWLIASAAAAIVAIAGIYSCWRHRRSPASMLSDPLAVAIILLLSVCLTNIIQAAVMHTAYLSDRETPMYYLLFCMVLVFFIREIVTTHLPGAPIVAAAIVLFYIFNFYRTVSLRYVYEWTYDAHTYEVIDYMRQHYDTHPRQGTVRLGIGGHYFRSFDFYTSTEHPSWLSIADQSDSAASFYYCPASDTAAHAGFIPVRQYHTVDIPADNVPVIQVLMIRHGLQ